MTSLALQGTRGRYLMKNDQTVCRFKYYLGNNSDTTNIKNEIILKIK
jgi:hypothetical protein